MFQRSVPFNVKCVPNAYICFGMRCVTNYTADLRNILYSTHGAPSASSQPFDSSSPLPQPSGLGDAPSPSPPLATAPPSSAPAVPPSYVPTRGGSGELAFGGPTFSYCVNACFESSNSGCTQISLEHHWPARLCNRKP